MNIVLVLLKERGASLAWLARQVRMPSGHLRWALYEMEYPRYWQVVKIAHILGVEPDTLVDSYGHWRQIADSPVAQDAVK